MKWGEVFARDLFRCAIPVCTSRNVTPHHMQYKSAGGSDDSENNVEALQSGADVSPRSCKGSTLATRRPKVAAVNMASPCHVDHLGNIHVHRSIKLYPPASRPRWVFGRDKTVLLVEGRDKLAAS